MPNHVYSSMKITGDPTIIKTFSKKHFDEGHFDLNSFIPMPDELKGSTAPSTPPRDATELELARFVKQMAERVEKYGADNWYDWRINNWGTKWGTYDGNMDTPTEHSIVCNFQTAWNLPDKVFEVMAEMYPTLTFQIECVEEGGFFSGAIAIVDGVIDDSNVTNDDEQWKQYAIDMMGWNFDEDDEEERQDVIDMIDYAKDKLDKPDTIINELILFAKENIDDFIKFSKN